MTRTPTFDGTCRKSVPVPYDKHNPDHTDQPSRWDPKLKAEVIWTRCDFETGDRKQFEEHQRKVHGARFLRPSWAPSARWRAPKLTEEGIAFRPTGMEVGAEITWSQDVPTGQTQRVAGFNHVTKQDEYRDVPVTRRAERTGQVWSPGPAPRSAWVIPEDLLPGEMAVLLRRHSADSEIYVDATLTNSRRDEAVA
ncbi:hypothetical protein HMPREF0063_11937 [Aeromicrobium marinum DSM 15272]|uniref:Uncharacterized protein n=1 Tax=Aeromicrobium marinum DSM 15272 TaxID=585531 RepID=E2SE01_9ACTN|nr:hypothetical protein [Aeromicrobium marinum]EFQ82728.1 hypothetical protein HMPREF0063_11937 [Aeromicrobium marinum DSM 15272]